MILEILYFFNSLLKPFSSVLLIISTGLFSAFIFDIFYSPPVKDSRNVLHDGLGQFLSGKKAGFSTAYFYLIPIGVSSFVSYFSEDATSYISSTHPNNVVNLLLLLPICWLIVISMIAARRQMENLGRRKTL